MLDLQPIQQKIQSNRDAIANQQDLIKALAEEESNLNNQLSNCSCEDEIDELFDTTDERLKEIAKERAKAKLRVKAYQSALANAELELVRAKEANCIELRKVYEKDLKQDVVEHNKIVDAFIAKMTQIVNRVDEAHLNAIPDSQRFKPSYETNAYFYQGNSIAGTSLNTIPKLLFNCEQSRIEVLLGSNFDRVCKHYRDKGIEFIV